MAKNRLLEQLALTDALTNLPNRRAIDDWANRQLSGAARYGFAFWIVIADLDDFKSVNDNYGHESGDVVLKSTICRNSEGELPQKRYLWPRRG